MIRIVTMKNQKEQKLVQSMEKKSQNSTLKLNRQREVTWKSLVFKLHLQTLWNWAEPKSSTKILKTQLKLQSKKHQFCQSIESQQLKLLKINLMKKQLGLHELREKSKGCRVELFHKEDKKIMNAILCEWQQKVLYNYLTLCLNIKILSKRRLFKR